MLVRSEQTVATSDGHVVGLNAETNLSRIKIEKEAQRERLKEVGKTHDRTWKQEILIMAQILEQEYRLTDKPIEFISEEITNILREDGVKIWYWAHDYLPSKYKQQKYIGNRHGKPCDKPESAFLQSFRTLSQAISLVPAAEVAEIVNLCPIIEQQGTKRAEEEHIALLPSNSSSVVDQTNDSKKRDQKHVSIDYPEAQITVLSEAFGRGSEIFKNVQGRVNKFPPEILAKAFEYATGLNTFLSMFDPSLDLKYSKNWSDWFVTETQRDVFGKHAAAVMSFSVTNLCANCSDERTKEWVRMEPVCLSPNFVSYECLQCKYQVDTVCPSCNLSMKLLERPVIQWECSECGSTTPMTRDLTREQVGDKSSIIVEKAIEVLEHIPAVVAFSRWYRDWIEPRVASRKKRLADELSEKA